MKRIRCYYGCNIVGSEGYKDRLLEESEDPAEEARMVMEEYLMPESWFKEIADDDDSWEGE